MKRTRAERLEASRRRNRERGYTAEEIKRMAEPMSDAEVKRRLREDGKPVDPATADQAPAPTSELPAVRYIREGEEDSKRGQGD